MIWQPLAVNHIQTFASAALRPLVCSAQLYNTAPYSHGNLDAWSRPWNPWNRAAAASAFQTTTIQYSPFPGSSDRTYNRTGQNLCRGRDKWDDYKRLTIENEIRNVEKLRRPDIITITIVICRFIRPTVSFITCMNANIRSQSNVKQVIRDVRWYGTLTYQTSTPPW